MRIALALLICSLCSVSWAGTQPSDADLQKLKKEIQTAQKQIQEKHGEESKLEKELRDTETQLGKIESEVIQLKQSIDQQQQQLNQLNQEAEQLNTSRAQQEEQIIAQINASYRMGRENRVKILLNQESPQKLSRSLVYSDYFNRARIDSINEYKATLQQIDINKTNIEQKSQELLVNKDELVNKQKTLKASYDLRTEALAKLKDTIKTDKDKLKKLELDRSELETLLRSIHIAIENIKLPSDSLPFQKAKGKLLWPTNGQQKNRFGSKRPPGNLTWQGTSFYAPSGKEVKAVHHGRVIFADWFRGKGLLLIIDHGDGYMTLYAHNQSLLRETGDWVSAGETVAAVGDSGGLDHPELYFEIRHQGQPLNPRHWLRKKG